jgi:hypothetical protein
MIIHPSPLTGPDCPTVFSFNCESAIALNAGSKASIQRRRLRLEKQELPSVTRPSLANSQPPATTSTSSSGNWTVRGKGDGWGGCGRGGKKLLGPYMVLPAPPALHLYLCLKRVLKCKRRKKSGRQLTAHRQRAGLRVRVFDSPKNSRAHRIGLFKAISREKCEVTITITSML